MIAEHQLVIYAADEVAGRVVVHVHLLDDHALLAVDLVRVELRVPQHVDEHVERHVAELARAPDVVARVLLGGEGVELAADPVYRRGDVTRLGAALSALEEDVLGEVSDAVGVRRLVARAGRQHDQARHRLRLGHGRGQHPQAVRQLGTLEGPRLRRRFHRPDAIDLARGR
jgi:hypothetical protein